jgi:ABC transporter substrate binding protein/Tripartite tricarboxylate transporter family receptor
LKGVKRKPVIFSLVIDGADSPNRRNGRCNNRRLRREIQFPYNLRRDRLPRKSLEAEMRRREFIAGLAGSSAWVLTARAQQSGRIRRIGIVLGWSEEDPQFRSWFTVFVQELARLGWIDGASAQIENRWTNADIERTRLFAKELVALQPDVVVTSTTPVTAALRRETNSIPIVFIAVVDPVGFGFVASLSRPGGNITGFIKATAWWGVGAPKNTPADIIDKLNREINAGLADPKIRARFADLGGTAMGARPPTSASWSSTKPRSGGRWSGRPT